MRVDAVPSLPRIRGLHTQTVVRTLIPDAAVWSVMPRISKVLKTMGLQSDPGAAASTVSISRAGRVGSPRGHAEW